MKKYTQETFLEKCREVHGNKYDYSKVVFTGVKNKICIICPEHGEFWQNAHDHIAGHGCDKCGGTFKLDTNEFIKRANITHNNKYDYSKAQYINAATKICIICPEHGEFWQLPINHIKGAGCPKCSGKCENTEDYINNARKVHGDKYDYSKVQYTKSNDIITIICPKHGEFEQRAVKHLQGHGCPKCGIENRRKKQFLTQDEFIEKAKQVHGDKYDYSKVEYKSMRDKICIICPDHGEFLQFPFDHINEHGCPKCGQLMSKGENEIYEYLLGYLEQEDIIRNDRKTLNGKEIDIYIPSKKVGFEYNGLKWHSEEFNKDFSYHLNKTEEAKKNGIKLIQIFEDEYINHKNIVLNKIKHILNLDTDLPKIPGRKCVVHEINKSDAEMFLNKYHIQSYGKCTISYGSFYNSELIAVMSFLKEKNNSWSLVRFASNYNYICQGVGSKLLNFFIRNNHPVSIKTFADRRWTVDEDNNIYTKFGFKLDKVLKPDYRYVNIHSPNERIHKANLRKRSIHKKYGLPLSMTEKQMTQQIGLSKIWDCGLYRYIWKNGAIK